MDKFDQAVEMVREERKRQIEKWGKQDHTLFVWMSILMEEVGEAAQAALHQTFGGKAKGTFGTEIIHVAAVAVQIIEWILDADDIETPKTVVVDASLFSDLVDAAGWVGNFYTDLQSGHTPEFHPDWGAAEYLASEAVLIEHRGRIVLEAAKQVPPPEE